MPYQHQSIDTTTGLGNDANLKPRAAPARHRMAALASRAGNTQATKVPRACRPATGLRKPQLSLTAALVAAAIGLPAPQAQAQSALNLVLDTGNNSALPSRITSNGAPIIRVGPSNPTVTFNGVTIRYVGTESVAPLVSDRFVPVPTTVGTMGKFIVLGDLNLASNQKIFGVGPNLVRLEVANNASIASGATIDVSAQGALAGAGGGGGGQANASPMIGSTPSSVPYFPGLGGFATNTTGIGRDLVNNSPDGQKGEDAQPLRFLTPASQFTVSPGSAEYAALFRSVAGGAGQAGQGNAAIAAGGVERVYKRILGPNDLPDPKDPGVAELVVATPGGGGAGGTRGGLTVFGSAAGNPGGAGANGGNGGQGLLGASASAIQTLLNAAVVSLRGGNGGGAGATGGAGLPGADGGAGGGGGASAVGSNGGRRAGGNGGDGGAAGVGGSSGLGGQGGGGGGGIQLLVRGALNMATGAAVLATGGNAGAGLAGGAGSAGGAGGAGQAGDSSFTLIGGRGGNGGNGGAGGAGGAGGNGTGGTGGVVQIAASSFTFNGYADTQGGLSGNGFDRSANGETYIHAYSGQGASYSTSTYFGARAAGSNPYRSFSGVVAFGTAPDSLAPNLPSIVGGAAPYGLLTGETAAPGVTPLTVAEGVKFVTDIAAPPVAGHKRVGAVTRMNAEVLSTSFGIAGYDNSSQQVILFSAFDSAVAKPALMVVDPSHQAFLGDYVPSGPMPLRQGNGYLNDPSLTAGAVAPTDMASLAARSTFAMVASGTQVVTASFTPYAAARTFTGTPVPAGNFGLPGATTVFLEDRGLLRLGAVARSVDANRNSGITSQRETTGSFDTTATASLRAGGNNVLFATAQGVGSVDTATSGNATVRTLQAAAGTANATALLANQASVRYDNVGRGQFWASTEIVLNTKGLAIGTTQRVAEVDFTPEYDDTTRTITATVDARLFGPTPRLQGQGTSGNSFTFAAIQAGTAVISRFSLQNANVLSSLGAVWANAINADPELIRLTILGVELVDPSGVFSINGIGNMPMPFSLDGDQTAPVDIRFSPTAEGQYAATLRFLTDQNAPVGQAGDIYAVSLFAAAVDEPPALLLLLGGGLALLLRRHRRAGSPAH